MGKHFSVPESISGRSQRRQILAPVQLCARQLADELDAAGVRFGGVRVANAVPVAPTKSHSAIGAFGGSVGNSCQSTKEGLESFFLAICGHPNQSLRVARHAYRIGPYGQTVNAPWWIKWGTRGALIVADVSAALAGVVEGADILFGESVKLSWVKVPRVGIHFGWEASGEWFHAIGGRGEMIIEEWANVNGGCRRLLELDEVPVLNPGSAAEMVGESCFNCLTGHARRPLEAFLACSP